MREQIKVEEEKSRRAINLDLENHGTRTVCPGSSYPFCIVPYHKKGNYFLDIQHEIVAKVAHAWRQLSNALNISNCRFPCRRANLFLSYHLI